MGDKIKSSLLDFLQGIFITAREKPLLKTKWTNRLPPYTVHHRLNVDFLKKNALDINDVTREMFSWVFFYATNVKFFFGNCKKNSKNGPQTLFSSWRSSAIPLSCVTIATTLSPVVDILTGTGCVCHVLLLSSFIQHANEAKII